MPIRRNIFKAAIQARDRAQIGLWVGLADAVCAEICAGTGFDWLLIDGEHAPNDLQTILAQLQAVAAYPVHPVVRPVTGDPNLIKQLLDIGAQTLLIPMVNTAAQAQALVAAMRYPPEGVRGIGSSLARASQWDRNPDYVGQSNAEMCLLVQIETVMGLKNLEAIAAVDGVDGVFLGPSDLAGALGYPGDPGHAEVQRILDDAMGRTHAAGKPSGIITTSEVLARRYLSHGCTFIAVGIDALLLRGAAEDLARRFQPREL